MARLEPLPMADVDGLAPALANFSRWLGVAPNSLRIMARRPALVEGFAALASACWSEDSEAPVGFKRLVGYLASRVQGCQYCMAHNAGAALRLGIAPEKVEAVWEYQTSPLFSAAERAALDFAVAAAAQPNAVTDELFEALRVHWTENQICEILYVVCLFGFMNRWNDSLASPLEEAPASVGAKHLARSGWQLGIHAA